MNKTYVGIDVGAKGAIAAIYNSSVAIYSNSSRLNLALLDPKRTIVALEDVHAMPKQGVSSTFSFGKEFGWFLGALDMLKLPYRLVRPQVWQKALGIPKVAEKAERKRLIYETARRLFPTAELLGARGAILDGRSDALMIAYWLSITEKGERYVRNA